MLQEVAEIQQVEDHEGYVPLKNMQSETGSAHPALKMKLDLVVSETAEIIIFHDRPFINELSWIEFDLDTRDLNFIFEDGEVRNFGVHVPLEHTAYMQNAYSVNILRVLENDVIDGFDIPLILHRA